MKLKFCTVNTNYSTRQTIITSQIITTPNYIPKQSLNHLPSLLSNNISYKENLIYIYINKDIHQWNFVLIKNDAIREVKLNLKLKNS